METTGGIRIFERLNCAFPEKEIFLRLGGNCFKTTLDETARLKLMQISRNAFELCSPQGRFSVLPVTGISGNGVRTPEGFLELGKNFCSATQHASHLWLGAVTIGGELTSWRDASTSVTDSAIADAVGSECADAAMDVLYLLARSELRRRGLVLDGQRFSPGYGDMPLALQSFFYRKLNMDQMGVFLNTNNFLLPEKSVTAFAFIHNLQEKQP